MTYVIVYYHTCQAQELAATDDATQKERGTSQVPNQATLPDIPTQWSSSSLDPIKLGGAASRAPREVDSSAFQ